MATITQFVLLVLFSTAAAQWRRNEEPMKKRMQRQEEEARKVCLFLPLENSEGRRLGTCCVFPGRHRRFFGEAVLARKSQQQNEEVINDQF